MVDGDIFMNDMVIVMVSGLLEIRLINMEYIDWEIFVGVL